MTPAFSPELAPLWSARRGFSLLELLVSIVLLAVLAAVLGGLTLHLRERMQSSRCISHLRALYVGTISYAQDYNHEIPVDRENSTTGRSWYKALIPYVPHPGYGTGKGPYFCPSNPVATDSSHNGWTNYAINYNLYDGGENLGAVPSGANPASYFKTRRGPRIVNIPAGRILYLDSFNGASGSAYQITGPRWSTTWGDCYAVHDDRVNIVFLDGHIVSPRVSPRTFSSKGDLNELQAAWFPAK